MVLGHMDHVLLGGPQQWAALRPAAVLQVGGHLTSKRLGQFLDWAALGGRGRCGPPLFPPHFLLFSPSHSSPPPPPPIPTLRLSFAVIHISRVKECQQGKQGMDAAKLDERYRFLVNLLRALAIACQP